MITPQDITGLVLAGGQGTRMGGADKGLQLLDGTPLALHALRRLAPQVGTMLVSANRNHAAYAAFGAPVPSAVMAGRYPDHPQLRGTVDVIHRHGHERGEGGRPRAGSTHEEEP